jgi:hypothetical protein
MGFGENKRVLSYLSATEKGFFYVFFFRSRFFFGKWLKKRASLLQTTV